MYPLTGYAFAEGVSVTYEGSDDKLTNIESTAETITLDIGPFPQTSMNDQDGTTTPVKVSESDLDLAPYIPAPTAGGTPVRSFGAATFVGIVAWTDGEEAVPGLFEPGKSHTAAVTLYATAGYTFKDVPGYIHSKGGTVGSVNTSPEAGDVTLTVSFTTPTEGAPWAAAEPEPVTLLDLTGLIPAPAAGAVPAATVVSDEYIGIVSWRVTGGGAHSGLFQAYTAYTAEATLYPLAGYTFDGIPATSEEGCFFHGMSNTVAHGEGAAGSPLTVTITFLALHTAPIVVGW